MPKARHSANRLFPRRGIQAAVLAAAYLTSLPAMAGTPRALTAFPAVAQRGTEQEVVFTGANLSDARTILFDDPGFEVTPIKAVAGRFTVKIRVPADAELGEHSCRIITRSGVSDLRLFFVTPFPVVEEANPSVAERIPYAQAALAQAAAKEAEKKAADEAATAKAAQLAAAQAAAKTAAPATAAPATAAPATAAPAGISVPITLPKPAVPAPVAPAPPAPVAATAKPAPIPATVGGSTDPQLIELNTTVFGQTQGEDQDWYAVELKKGQRLSVEVVGLQLQTQSPYDPEVILKKPDGSVLKAVANTTFARGNPAFSIEVPDAGRYTLTIRDSTRSGAGLCHYVMHVGDFPRPMAAFPAGGPPGRQTSFTLYGDEKGPIPVKASPGTERDSIGALYPASGQVSPSPVYARVSELPNILESGSQAASPALVTGPANPLPAAFNGIIKTEREKDFFRFSAKKGQIYELNVFARSLRSPLDSVLYIYDAKGAQLATNDDSGQPDSYLRWTAPADGEFIIGVKDQLDRGGPLFNYRVEVVPASRRVKMWLPEMILNSSQERRAVVVPQGNRYATLVRVKREDWAGSLTLEPLNLPPNVEARSGTMDKSVDTIAMVFEAASDAPLTQRLISMTGNPAEAVEGEQPVFRIDHVLSPCENGNQRPYYTVKERTLPMAVTEPIPAQIDVETPSTPAIRAGQFPLKVKLTRKNDFKGPVELFLLHSPTGIATAGSTKIPADSSEGVINLSVKADAPLLKWTLCVVASADFGKGPTWFSSGLFDLQIAESPFLGTLARASISQGATSQMKLKLEPKSDFEGKAKIELLGLPNGVSSEPVEVDKDTKEVTFNLSAKPDASLGFQKQVTAQFLLQKNGTTLSASCAAGGIIRVDKLDPDAPPATLSVANAAAQPKPVAPAPTAPAPTAPAPTAPAPTAPAPTAPAPTAPAPASPSPK